MKISLICFLALLTTISCTQNASERNSFIIALNSQHDTLDWNNTKTIDGVLNLITEPLLTYKNVDGKWRIQGALATDWKPLQKGKKWQITLRTDVKWSDGVKLHAKHVKDSILRFVSPKSRTYLSSMLFVIKGATQFNKGNVKAEDVGVSVIDDHTIVFELKKPIVYFPHLLTLFQAGPIRKDLIEKYPKGQWLEPKYFVGLGPYLIEEHKPETHLSLKSNPNYYAGERSVKKIKAQYIAAESTVLRLYQKRRIDFSFHLPTIMKELKPFPELKMNVSSTIRALNFDTKFSNNYDIHFRKAVHLAIDRNQIAQLYPFAAPQWQFLSPNLAQIKPNFSDFKSQLAEAKRILKKSKHKAKVEIYYSPSAKAQRILENIQAQLKKNLNLTIELKPLDKKMFYNQAENNLLPIYYIGYGPDYPDFHSSMEFNHSSSSQNWIRWQSAEYDKLLQKAESEFDMEKRKKLYLKAHQIFMDDAYYTPLVAEKYFYLLSPKYTGFSMPPFNRKDFRWLKRK